MGLLLRIDNGPMPTTSVMPKVATGTTLKTMLQVLHPDMPLDIVEWGISFDGSAAAAPVQVELLTTGTVAATVTASAAADISLLNTFTDTSFRSAGGLTLSTTGTGYTASGEGAITTTRQGDRQNIAPSNQYLKQWPLDQEFHIPAGQVLRIRVLATATVNCYCYVVAALGGS